MTTSQQIARFITNLDDDQFIGFNVFDKLCDHFNWQGLVFGDLDIAHVFHEVAGHTITETELETIRDSVDLHDILMSASQVVIEHLTTVVSQYLDQQEDKDE
jgi:hypothetical protein